jgi:hypothetical protein
LLPSQCRDEDGHDADYIKEHLPDKDAGVENPDDYDAERDALGFQDKEVDHGAAAEQAFEDHFAKIDTNDDGFLDYNEVCDSYVLIFTGLHVSMYSPVL